MKLVALQVHAAGPNGWGSAYHSFGDRVTEIFGENGSGKTPLVQFIVYALGYRVDFRDDVIANCESVSLEVISGERSLTFIRKVQVSFSVGVKEGENGVVDFVSERELSRFLLSLWGLCDPVLTTVGSDKTHIYGHQILPLYYLDQDRGYSEEYFSQQKFIKDQYSEAMRLVFGLPPRNLFDKRREKIELKDKLEYLDRTVLRHQEILAELSFDLAGPRRPLHDIDRDLEIAIGDLDDLKSSSGSVQLVSVELDDRIARLKGREVILRREKSSLESRVRGFAQIRNEIEVEANTLSMNEEARRIFASFDAICSNDGCGLFSRSSASYGKSLLYLKDQVKDLERTNDLHSHRISELDVELRKIADEINACREEREEREGQDPVNALVEAVSTLTESVITLRRAKRTEQELLRIEEEYVARLQDREAIQVRLSGLEANRGSSDIELIRTKNAFSERIRHWMEVLRTSNISFDVQVDNDFHVSFGGQRVSRFKGSTLTRVVLAIRTAAFDLSIRQAGAAPRFFILDTPRQQDISREDLAEYIRNLQILAGENGAQVVYSTTNQRYPLGTGDVEWLPRYPGEKHEMFLGREH